MWVAIQFSIFLKLFRHSRFVRIPCSFEEKKTIKSKTRHLIYFAKDYLSFV